MSETLGDRLPKAVERIGRFLGSDLVQKVSREFVHDVMALHACAALLRPIETAPKDGTYVLLFGPSGYFTTPLRCDVARWDAEYRPRDPWVTYSNECFSSSGQPPTHWMPLPTISEE